jgi:hypothetical protein
MLRGIAIAVLASACGFTPNSASVDAHTSSHPDAHEPIDGGPHVTPMDAKVFLDAMTPPAFDPTMCPMGYSNNTVTASPNSRYRVINQAADFTTNFTACMNDHPGWTHLVVLDTVMEATQIHAALGGNPYYVGAVQPQDQATVGTGWLQLTGEAVPTDLWQPSQPNDNGGDNSENNEQNLTAADDSSGLMNDVSGSFQYLGVCECDGKPIAPAALAALN